MEREVINHQMQMLVDTLLPWVLLAVESTRSQFWDPNLLLKFWFCQVLGHFWRIHNSKLLATVLLINLEV